MILINSATRAKRVSEAPQTRRRLAIAVRPTVESCERRLLLSHSIHTTIRQVEVGGMVEGMITSRTPVSPVSFSEQLVGSGLATGPLGRFTLKATQLATITSPTTVNVTDGTLTLTSTDGSQIKAIYQTRAAITQPLTIYGDPTFTIIGGTKRFRGVTGTLTSQNTTDDLTDKFSIIFFGDFKVVT